MAEHRQRGACAWLMVLAAIGAGCDGALDSVGTSSTSDAPKSVADGAPTVRLLRGVALAQTTTDGTVMGFQVEYRSTASTASSSDRYVWVIEPPQGPAREFPLDLQPEGAPAALVPEWGATEGTYSAHIDLLTPDGPRRTVSNRLQLTYGT